MGVDVESDRIVSDSISTRHLVLLRDLGKDLIYPLVDTVLDRFYLQILPQIRYKINFLTFESSSMERILGAADYPLLYDLGLYNVGEKSARRFFTDEFPLFDVFSKKIQSLTITTIDKKNRSKNDFLITIITSILNIFNNLRYLSCHPFVESYLPRLSFEERTPIFFSSTLVELHINMTDFNDCIYLLDGRLNQVRRFYVNICYFHLLLQISTEKMFLPNMKCFSLTCKSEILFCYNKNIVSLLQRMTILEQLALYIFVGQQTFIDGNCLKNDVINHLLRLSKFIFNIRSYVHDLDHTHILSNEYIQHTLTGLTDVQVVSCVDYCPREGLGQCGLFKRVREVSLFDEHPFEHEFFIRIARAFPLLEKLFVINETPQKQKLNNNNKQLPIIEYPYLTELNFINTHNDYVEQFLLDTGTCLPSNITLFASYGSLNRITNNFTGVAMRANCRKINCLYTFDQFQISERLTKYFPNAKISI